MKITLTEMLVVAAILIVIIATSWAAVTQTTREDEIIRGCESPIKRYR